MFSVGGSGIPGEPEESEGSYVLPGQESSSTGGLGTHGPPAPSSSSPHVWNHVCATGIPKLVSGECPGRKEKLGVQARGRKEASRERKSPFVYLM